VLLLVIDVVSSFFIGWLHKGGCGLRKDQVFSCKLSTADGKWLPFGHGH
jgi:hypothetical protein